MSELRKQLADYAKTDDERNMLKDEDLKTRILQNLNRTNQERIRDVIYNIFLYDSSGKEIDFAKFEIKESDLLFGTK